MKKGNFLKKIFKSKKREGKNHIAGEVETRIDQNSVIAIIPCKKCGQEFRGRSLGTDAKSAVAQAKFKMENSTCNVQEG